MKPITEFSADEIYAVLTRLVQPRPVAIVTTFNAEGLPHAAPYSFCNLMGVNPPVLALGPSANSLGEDKETLKNLEARKKFGVFFFDRAHMDTMAILASPSLTRWLDAGLEPCDAESASVPLIPSAASGFVCEWNSTHRIGQGPGATIVVLGEITGIQMPGDPTDYHPIARMGGNQYLDTRIPEIFEP
jgi:flavin reductase (DIM6/NTAB) family NADH-FMN oxidoreductase RutF